jgi:hypothetical protein
MWQCLRDAIEHTTIATAGDTPLQGKLEMPVLLARDEVNGLCLFAPEGDESTGVLSFVVPRKKPFNIRYLCPPWGVDTLKSIMSLSG